MKGPQPRQAVDPYHEIEIRFAAAGEGRLQARVDTPAGDSEWQELSLPLAAAEAERLAHDALLAVSRGRRGEEPARRLGQALFAALFSRQALGRYHATLGAARAAAPPLRLRFHLGAGSAAEQALHRLPWELLCEPGEGDGRLLALDRHLSVVRHLTVPDGVAQPPRPPRLRVLVAAAEGRSPGADRLDLGGEIDAIRAACREDGGVAIEVLRPATLDGLIARLRDGGFHVLHLSGHGDLVAGGGVVLLPDAAGRLAAWHGERLAEQLDRLSPLRLVVLNACRTAEAVAGRPFAGVAGALLARGLPAVVAMQAPIADVAAAAFATALYERLAAGAGLDAAVAEGRLGIARRRPRTCEWAVPVLFSRLRGGDLFARPEDAVATAPARRRPAIPALLAVSLLVVVLGLTVPRAGRDAPAGETGSPAAAAGSRPPVVESAVVEPAVVEPRHAAATAPGGSAAPACGAVRSLLSDEAFEIPELGATLVPRILEQPGLGAYVVVSLLGPRGDAQRTANRPAALDFGDDAPLVVRVLAIDATAGTVRLSCHLAD